MRPSRRFALLASATALLASVGVAATGSPALAAGALFGSGDPGFVVSAAPSSLSCADCAGEPSLGINWQTGAGLFMSGTSTYKLSFTGATPTWSDASSLFSLENLDPILATDPTTGTTLAGGDTGACSAMSRTTDDGTSWLPSAPCTGTYDHPTVGWAPSAVTPGTHVWYYCQQGPDEHNCATSTDGGTTWIPGTTTGLLTCIGIHGHIKGSNDGYAYLPGKSCFDANSNLVVGGEYTHDDGASWTEYTIPGATETAFDPAVTVTPDGTLYEAWEDSATSHPLISASTDHGTTWSATPTDLASTVSPPLVASSFPTLVSGDNGRLAYSFLGTSVGTGNPNTSGFHGVWYLYTSYSYDGGQTWTTVKDTTTPVQYGEIDSGGTGSSLSQRNLLDFMDSSMTKDGRVVVGFADGCLADCEAAGAGGNQATAESLSTHAYATVAYQNAGVGLLAAYDGSGTPVTTSSGTPCPGGRAGFTDKAGDANEVVVTGTTPGPNDPALDLLDGSITWNAATNSAVLRARIADLTQAPLAGDGYYRWSVQFGSDATNYQIYAQIPSSTTSSLPGQAAAPSYGLFDNSTGSTVVSQTLAGSVDMTSGVVEIDLSSAQYQAAKAGNPPLTGNTVATVGSVLAQRAVVAATLTADTSDSTCKGTLAPPATAPAAPVLSGGASGSAVNLSWTVPANGGSAITGYQVFRGTSSGALSQVATAIGTSWTDSSASLGQTYYYAVAATNAVGASPKSNTFTATPMTVPDAPALTAQATTNAVSLTWNAPANGGSPITGYVIERGTAPGTRSTLTTFPASTTTYSDTSAAPGTAYYYAVRAVNAVGTGAASNEASATAYTTASTPSLTAVAGRGQVALSWSTPANGGQPIQGYRIYRGTASGGETLVQTISTGTTYVDPGLAVGTYFYRVAAVTAAGVGALSNEVSAAVKKA